MVMRELGKAVRDFIYHGLCRERLAEKDPARLKALNDLRRKVEWSGTDICRGSSVSMRKCQFLESRYLGRAEVNGEWNEETLPRCSRRRINVFEFMHGMHMWLRQVAVHWGYYQWMSFGCKRNHINAWPSLTGKNVKRQCRREPESEPDTD